MFCILAQNGSSGASDESGNPQWLASSDISLGVFYPFKIKKTKKKLFIFASKSPSDWDTLSPWTTHPNYFN